MSRRRFFTRSEFTGAHMAAVIFAFFGVIIAVNLVMAWHASRSWTGLIVRNSYVASQHFNETVEAIRTQRARGWQQQFELGNGSVSVRLTDAAGSPLRMQSAAVTFRRAAHERDDHTVALDRTADGSYSAPHAIADGIWVVEIDADLGGEAWRDSFRIRVRKGVLEE